MVIAAALLGCGAHPPAMAKRTADKAALFGDPTLVPTREGEAARRELAQSGEVAAVLRATGWIEGLHVDVEHRGPRVDVVIAGRRTADAPDDLEAHIAEIVARVSGEGTALSLAIAEPITAPRPQPRLLPLGLAVFGLGACAALLADRTWRRRRRLKRRGGTRAPS